MSIPAPVACDETLKNLMNEVSGFFDHCNGSFSDGATSGSPAITGRMSLLEVSCLGNPEKTLQGELLHYLRILDWNVVQEIGYLHAPGVKRSPDFGIFDSFGSHKKLICVVELKHHSANQSSAQPLINALDIDYLQPRPAVPLMQIGLYTAVTAIAPPLALPYTRGIYRFLNTYCTGTFPPSIPSGNLFFSSWSSRTSWLNMPIIGCTEPSSFQTPTGSIVSGHIEYFIGIRD
jgi:hypothetical protein